MTDSVSGTDDYPRSYRPSVLRSALFPGIAGVALVALDPLYPPMFLIVGVLFLVFCLYSIAATATSRVVLHADRIELVRWGKTRGLDKADIAGREVARMGGPAALVLRPKKEGVFPLILPLRFKTDEAWAHWMDGIPDLGPVGRRR